MKTFVVSLLGAALAISFTSSAGAQSGPASLSPQSGQITVHAFIWDSTHGMKDLGTLGGKISYAVGLSDSGTVVCYSQLKGDKIYHAFLWTPKRGMVDIGVSYPGSGYTDASDVNANGEVAAAGNYSPFGPNGFQVPAIFKMPNHWISYTRSTGGANNFAFAITDAGVTTGQYYITVSGDPYVEAFVWRPKGGSFTPLISIPGGSQNIGTLNGSTYTAARGINDNDEIAGLNYAANRGPSLCLALRACGHHF